MTCRPSREPGNGIPEAGRDSHVQPTAELQKGANPPLFHKYIAHIDKDSSAKEKVKLQVRGIFRLLRNFNLERNYSSLRYYLTEKKK